MKAARQLSHDRAASVQELPAILPGPDLQRVPGRERRNGPVHGLVRPPAPREAQVDVPQAEPLKQRTIASRASPAAVRGERRRAVNSRCQDASRSGNAALRALC